MSVTAIADHLPNIDGTYNVLPGQVEALRRNGHIQLKGVFTPQEIAAYRPVIRDYVMSIRQAMDTQDQSLGTSTRKTNFSIGNAPEEVVRFVKSPRLAEIAARFLGVEALRLLHFCGFFKPGGGPPTGWHQDLGYVPLDTAQVIAIWIPLMDITSDMGTLVFAEGSHLHGQLDAEVTEDNFPVVENQPMMAGDVSLHLGWTLHSSLENSSSRMREAITIGYYADGARIQTRGEIPIVQSFLDSYFAGLVPGDKAIGELTPLVFESE
ncbi:MAG TPA: phytanoyl-CoA dioxygenase family protein [Pyrinomonadaceae bacterium]